MKKLCEGWILSEATPTYQGWPTVLHAGNGHLMVVSSGGRARHIDPFGRVYLFESFDEGQTWLPPRHLSNGPLDDRDAGIVRAGDDSLLVNWFTSIVFLRQAIPPHLKEAWDKVECTTTLRDIREGQGYFMIRSTDEGRTWSEKYRVPVNNVHGPTLLSDGSLLWVGRGVANGSIQPMNGTVCAYRSTDNGLTWDKLCDIAPVWHRTEWWHELHTIETPDGTIVCHIRNHEFVEQENWQMESTDGGYTWSAPHHVCYGLPPHLLNLPDGRILLTYGYRHPKFGVRARVSEDCCKSWGTEIILCDDANTGDLGYPSTVILDDGSLFTVWYQNDDTGARECSLRYLRWTL